MDRLPKITNVRYGPIKDGRGTILFESDGITCTATEPIDVLLVGWSGAADWIRRHYSFLLPQKTEA